MQTLGDPARPLQEPLAARVARGFDVVRGVVAAPVDAEASPARQRLRCQALELVQHEDLVDAAYSFCVVPLDAPPAELLQVGGERLLAPWLLPAAGQLTAVAFCVSTLGPVLEARVTELFGQPASMALGLGLDDLSKELLLAVDRRALDRMLVDTARLGLSMAGELRPGDPGLGMHAQTVVLRLAQADRIGVGLTDSLVMRPFKSTSMVMGVGIGLPPPQWSRCDSCPSRNKCEIVVRANATIAASPATLGDS